MQERKLAESSTVVPSPRPPERTQRVVPALTVISHPDLQRAGERLLLTALDAQGSVAVSRTTPEFKFPGALQGMPLADAFLSRKPLVFTPTADGGVRLSVEESGTSVYVADTPVIGSQEFSAEELVEGVPLVLAERIVLLLHQVSEGEPAAMEALGMVGYSVGTRRVREGIAQVADLKVPVLIRGETGSGKELVAQAIHRSSPRRAGPFISVNLGALPKELAAAELFGARKGAYTGAVQDREGFFRAAHGGTLFLDEVGEAPPEVQVLLLRVLETNEVYPVGGHSSVPVDVRLIAATDADLEERIRDELFKAPLLHRLAGYEIRVPPLRERREDIGVLFAHFARQELEAVGETNRLESQDPRAESWLPASVALRLLNYSWPGNIRQLRNLSRQLVIASRSLPSLRLLPHMEQELSSAATPASERVGTTRRQKQKPEATSSRRRPSDVSDQELLEALRATGWDMKAAAEKLGITRPSLYMLIDKSPSLRTAVELSPEEITRCFHECNGDLDAMVQRLEVSRRGLLRRIKDLGLVTS
ncbi:sigma 54-interacting transcriptional regulator [Hyalangium versicolor]|uniref:sigma 54-interacting transcriptional regulator n=1 Tax=Hyalangium versicolor TaxID=2861190 RepID=UPI001CC9B544|nr:sigma-54 dependent transcriptional regulator [Hyalangium versicolor]